MRGQAPAEPSPSRESLFQRWRVAPIRLWPAIVIIVATSLWLLSYGNATVARVRSGLDHPFFQLDNEEGALLAQVLQLRSGQWPYRPIDNYPFIVGTYPPVYLLTSAALTSSESPSLWGGRVVSAVGLLLSLAGLAIAAWRSSRSFFAALVAVGLFVATFEVYSWAPYFRVDMLALGLSLTGLAISLCLPRAIALPLAAVVFASAFFTKQTSIAAPLALLAALSIHERRSAVRFLLYLAAAIGVPLVILTAWTRGQFLIHTVYYNANRMNWNDLVLWVRHIARFYLFLLALCVASLATLRRQAEIPENEPNGLGEESPQNDRYDTDNAARTTQPQTHSEAGSETARSSGARLEPVLLASYFVISLLNILALTKAGSAENYLLEPLAAASLLVGSRVGSLLHEHQRESLRLSHPLHILAVLLVCHAVRITTFAPVMFGSKEPSPEDYRNASFLTLRLRTTHGPVISELACYAIFAGKEVLFQPFIMSELARQGRWDEEKILRDIRQKKFSVIATTVQLETTTYSDAFTSRMREAITTHYRLAKKLEDGRLWRHYVYDPVAGETMREVSAP